MLLPCDEHEDVELAEDKIAAQSHSPDPNHPELALRPVAPAEEIAVVGEREAVLAGDDDLLDLPILGLLLEQRGVLGARNIGRGEGFLQQYEGFLQGSDRASPLEIFGNKKIFQESFLFIKFFSFFIPHLSFLAKSPKGYSFGIILKK